MCANSCLTGQGIKPRKFRGVHGHVNTQDRLAGITKKKLLLAKITNP